MNDSNRIRKLFNSYNQIGQAVRMRLIERYPAKLIWGVFEDARRELALLAPQIPYIGDKNIWQMNLDMCVMNMAMYRSLKKRKFQVDEAVQIENDVFEAYIQSFPKPLHRFYHWYHFSHFHQKRLRLAATRSQERQYPADWVFTYVEGDGDGFNFGVDISECAILKFSQAHRVEEQYMPHLCRLDHAMSDLFALGFSRQSTLASGAPICDCRWKRAAALTI